MPQAMASPIDRVGGGSNQYYNAFPGMANPGQASMTSATGGPHMSSSPYPFAPAPWQVPQSGTTAYNTGASTGYGPQRGQQQDYSKNLGHGIIATGLQYPQMSQDFVNYLQSQIGQGMTPYNLQTNLPTGGATQPGQLTAGLNPMLQQLMSFFQGGGSSMPGADTLGNIANNGISALPEWQSMIAAQGQNIQQNQANLKEQFAGMGDLAGSPFGIAMSNYMQQTTLDQNALLGQLQQQNILQGQIPVAEGLMQGGTQFASGLQNLNQEAIQNMYAEFQRTQPQNNPLLQYQGAFGSLYPPTTKTPTGFDQFTSLLSALKGSGGSSSSTDAMDNSQASSIIF
jgi:hypothetical protein